MTFPATNDWLRGHAGGRPDAPAIHDASRGVTAGYRALSERADRLALALHAEGVGRGDRVALLAGASLDHFALLFACARLGAMLAPLNWRLAPRELRAIAADCAPRVLIHDDTLAELADACDVAPSRWQLSGRGDDAPRRITAPERTPRSAPRLSVSDLEAPLLLLYTSGTTGRPKGAMLPLRQLVANAVATTLTCDLAASDRCLVSLPLFHTGGLNCLATPTLFRGGTVVLTSRFDPAEALAIMHEHAVSTFIGVPTMIGALLDAGLTRRPPPAMRVMLCGGAPCPDVLVDRAHEHRVPLRLGFGMTEVGPNCFTLSPLSGPHRLGTVGRPVLGSEVRVVGGDGGALDPGDVGELWIRGPHVMLGYHGQREETARTLDADGWLHTGDLARHTEDGHYAIVGRKKEMFISGGENVYPAEVEAALAEHPGLARVAVVGVNDQRWGQVGLATVEARGELDPEELRTWARARLAGYKVPRHVRVVPALPLGATGKIDKLALLRAFESERRATSVPAGSQTGEGDHAA